MPEPLERLRSALAARYAIEREIGAGGMATVYLADDLKHGRKVAVKVLRPELAAAHQLHRRMMAALGLARAGLPDSARSLAEATHLAAAADSRNELLLRASPDPENQMLYLRAFVEAQLAADTTNPRREQDKDEAIRMLARFRARSLHAKDDESTDESWFTRWRSSASRSRRHTHRRLSRYPAMRLTVVVSFLLSATLGAQQPAGHALDPLSASEITRTVALLRDAGRLTPQSRFGTITVQPQAKSAPAPRAARVIGYDWSRNEGFLAVVDLDRGRVSSWTVVDSEPPMRLLTIRRAEEIAHADARWVAALRARGIDTARVSVLPSLPERAKLPREGNDRIVPTFVWLRDGVPDGYVMNGIRMSVNLTQGRLASFEDNGAPIRITDSSAMRALASPRTALRPLELLQSKGSSATIRGNEITWDRWTFRAGVDPRRGLEVHDVSFADDGRRRPVLYSGAISEIIAPYGDPEFASWYPRDEGDYGMGIYSMSSAVDNDVPGNARFISSAMHDHLGRPIVVPKAIAVYERDGGILWRHANMSRRARQLVVSGHTTIDNYDYQFNWVFGQDGTIESEVVLSGIMNVNPTKRQRDTAHVEGHSVDGHLVAPGINAPNHQHFFSYRLDLDVDGAANTIYEVDTEAPARGEANPEGESFTMTERPLASERKAIRDVAFSANRHWRVANTHATNTLGQFTGYTLVPGAATPIFALHGSAPRRTGGFTEHQFWATPYAPEELYAGGEFQNLGRDWEGLSTFVKADRSLADTDVVVWYTLGITHIPRPEDWPYMPAHRGSFRLVPTSFFARNPTLDVPR